VGVLDGVRVLDREVEVDGVPVPVPVAEDVGLWVGVTEAEAVDDGDDVTDADAPTVTLAVGVPVSDGVSVRVEVVVAVPVFDREGDGVTDDVPVEVIEALVEGVPVGEDVGVVDGVPTTSPPTHVHPPGQGACPVRKVEDPICGVLMQPVAETLLPMAHTMEGPAAPAGQYLSTAPQRLVRAAVDMGGQK